MKRDGHTNPSPLASSLSATLHSLCQLPLIDPVEMACIVDSQARSERRRLNRLVDEGLAVRLRHTIASMRQPSSRYAPTSEGVAEAARNAGLTPTGFVRPLPISAQWFQVLFNRLDSVAVIYRLASTIAVALGQRSGALQVYHQRRGPLDALLHFPTGQNIGVLRQGPTLDRSALTSRLWTVTKDAAGIQSRAILAALHTEGDRRHIQRYLTRLSRRGGHEVQTVFMAVMSESIHVTPDLPVWQLAYSSAAVYSFRELADFVKNAPASRPPTPRTYHRAALPKTEMLLNGHNSTQMQASEKHALDILLDWPLATHDQFANLLVVSKGRLAQILAELETRYAFVTAPFGDQAPIRYALSDAGLEYLALRDRSSRPRVLKHWSVSTNPLTGRWRGSRVRRLATEIYHTDAVNSIAAKISREAHDLSPTYEVRTLDPSHRSRRDFVFNRRRHTIHPDASGVIVYLDTPIPFLLEFERRARHPSKSLQRIRPYQAYFSTAYPMQDHGALPLVLVAFDDVGAETQFLIAAADAEKRSNLAVPFATSCLQALDEHGILGSAWRIPQGLHQHWARASYGRPHISLGPASPSPPPQQTTAPRASAAPLLTSSTSSPDRKR